MNTFLFLAVGTLVLNNLNFGHAYVSPRALEEHLYNVNKTDLDTFDIAQTGRNISEICQFWGLFGAIRMKGANESSLIHAGWSVIEFKLKLRTNETVYSVTVHNTTILRGDERQQHHTVEITPKMADAAIEFDGDIDYDSGLAQLNISLSEFGFAVWDIKVDHTTLITKGQVELIDRPSPKPDHSIGGTYLVKSTSSTGQQAYMNFTFEDTDPDKEYCFGLGRISHPHVKVDMFGSLFGSKQFNSKLHRFSRSYDAFCTSWSVYLRPLGRFDISLVFNGLLESDHPMVIQFIYAKLSKKTIPNTTMHPSSMHLDERVNVPKSTWWYNNPSLFEYTIVSSSVSPWYACDILANCYPYERKEKFMIEQSEIYEKNNSGNNGTHLVTVKWNETVWNFTLAQKYQSLLSHSPLIRLFNDEPDQVIFQKTPYRNANKISSSRIESHLRTTSPKLQLNSTDLVPGLIFYVTQVPRKTPISVDIPIHTVDLRTQAIETKIGTKEFEDRDEFSLVSVKLNGNKADNISRSIVEPHFNYGFLASVSTADYIQVAPWTMANGQVKSFGIVFEVGENDSDIEESKLVDVAIGFLVKTIDKQSGREIEKSHQYDSENCHKGPTYADLDCHQTEYRCPEYYFKYNPIAKTCTRTGEPMQH